MAEEVSSHRFFLRDVAPVSTRDSEPREDPAEGDPVDGVDTVFAAPVVSAADDVVDRE